MPMMLPPVAGPVVDPVGPADGPLLALENRPVAEEDRIHVGAAVKVAVSYQVLVVDPPAR